MQNEVVKLSTIEITVADGQDEQVWVQSTIAATHKLPRQTKDQFSFGQSDLVILTNRGSDFVTCHLRAIACAESGILIGSNRRGTTVLRTDTDRTLLMKPGEVLTIRSVYAVEPKPDAMGRPIPIRSGHITATA